MRRHTEVSLTIFERALHARTQNRHTRRRIKKKSPPPSWGWWRRRTRNAAGRVWARANRRGRFTGKPSSRRFSSRLATSRSASSLLKMGALRAVMAKGRRTFWKKTLWDHPPKSSGGRRATDDTVVDHPELLFFHSKRAALSSCIAVGVGVENTCIKGTCFEWVHRMLDTSLFSSKERERRSVPGDYGLDDSSRERERDPSHKEVGRSLVFLSQKKHKKNTHNKNARKKRKKKSPFLPSVFRPKKKYFWWVKNETFSS